VHDAQLPDETEPLHKRAVYDGAFGPAQAYRTPQGIIDLLSTGIAARMSKLRDVLGQVVGCKAFR
jgi:hypothetical protein